MIVVDTNVISEPLRMHPEPAVLDWLRRHPQVAVTAVSFGEMLRGAFQMPEGRRRDRMSAGIEAAMTRFDERILPYGLDSARVYARLHLSRRAAGRPLAIEDGMIAATAIANGATAVATRDVRDFAGLGLEIINPWDAAPHNR